MDRDDIPDDVRRFLLSSIPSVPHLEAILLLRNGKNLTWDYKQVAQRLYVNETVAAGVLSDLHEVGILEQDEGSTAFRYQPQTPELAQLLDRLEQTYASKLVQVTHLIHSKAGKNAQRFADAFIWRKDT